MINKRIQVLEELSRKDARARAVDTEMPASRAETPVKLITCRDGTD